MMMPHPMDVVPLDVQIAIRLQLLLYMVEATLKTYGYRLLLNTIYGLDVLGSVFLMNTVTKWMFAQPQKVPLGITIIVFMFWVNGKFGNR